MKRRHFVFWFVGLYTALYLGFMVAGPYWLSEYTMTLSRNMFALIGSCIGSIWLIRAMNKSQTPYRTLWVFMCVGVLSGFLGDVVWIYSENILRQGVDMFSPAYIFYGVTVFSIICALITWARGNLKTRRVYSWQLVAEILIFATVLSTLSWYFFVKPIFTNQRGDNLYELLSVAYMVLNLSIVLGVFGMYMSQKMQSLPHAFWLAIVSFTATNMAYCYVAIHHLYHSTQWIHAGWTLGVLLLGATGITHNQFIVQKVNIDELGLRDKGIKRYVPFLGLLVLWSVVLLEGKFDLSLILGITVAGSFFMIRQLCVFKQRDKLIDSLENKNWELFYSFSHNDLTGLFSRSYFHKQLQAPISQNYYPVTIVACDVDGLKVVNDTLGHDAGDRLLKNCANILSECTPHGSIAAHTGGDEFALMLFKTDKEKGEKLVNKIKEKIKKNNETHHELPLSLSMGLSTAFSDNDHLADTYTQADNYMYMKKLTHSKSSRSSVIQSLMAALEERDYVTQGHTQRLVEYCLKIAKKLKVPSFVTANLTLLAQTHDLGKVGIPDTILLKKGPLNAKEWEVMRQHTVKGYRIAMASENLAGIAHLILKHHERWDGRGYPDGIEGTDIPVECRIMAVVDSFDAMTNPRPYNRVKTHEEAIEELQKCAGTQFDPQMVELFVKVLQEEKMDEKKQEQIA